MHQFESAGKISSSEMLWGIAIAPDDGDDNVEDTTDSFVDMGAFTTTA